MEDNDDTRLIKFAVAASIPFFVSCFKSCDDLCYRCSGKTAPGVVSQISAHYSRGGFEGYDVSYQFTNANSERQVTGYTLVAPSELRKYPLGQNVEVEYRGGDLCSSRIKGSGGWFWEIVLVVSLLATVVLVIVLTVQSNRVERAWRARQRR